MCPYFLKNLFMKKTNLGTMLVLVLLASTVHSLFAQKTLALKPLVTFYTDVFNNGGVEGLAYDAVSKRIYYTSPKGNSLGILDASNPAALKRIDTIPMGTLGGKIKNVLVLPGQIAVALEANGANNNGKVVIFNERKEVVKEYTVGPAPDGMALTPDNRKILVANEAPPNNDYTNDPEGSVSIIDLNAGTVQKVDFSSYNNNLASLRNKGVRVTGLRATVAKDLEPESIAISPDGKRAFVTLQENNAVAAIDIDGAKVIDVFSPGLKDHSTGQPFLSEQALNVRTLLPEIGKPVYFGGQPAVRLGALSGLHYEPKESSDTAWVFYSIPDRGPVEEAVDRRIARGSAGESTDTDLRPFKLPNYQARLVRFTVHPRTREFRVTGQTLLNRQVGPNTLPITGRTNVPGFDEIPVTYRDTATIYKFVDWTNTSSGRTYTELPYDPFGGDFEGITRDRDGNFWLCDEYRPSVYKFRPNGQLIARYAPKGAGSLGVIPIGEGSYGDETLPEVYNNRWSNRGFEGIAYDSEKNIVYAFMQSPLDNPSEAAVRDRTDVIRILGLNPADGKPVAEYVYLLDQNRGDGLGVSRTDKLADATFIGKNKFLVVERDGSDKGVSNGRKLVFEINLSAATNLLADTTLAKLAAKNSSASANDKTLEMLSADELVARRIRPVSKRKILNLPSLGYSGGEKPEGIAILPNRTMVLVNDNDFGRAGANGADSIFLSFVSLGLNNSFDASDRDNGPNPRNHPVLGMYQPDGIKAFQHLARTYYVTANEGEGRENDAQAEEIRMASLNLDPQVFPKADSLKRIEVLGRLRISNATGDLDGDGDLDEMHSFGGRSFSILDDQGNLIFDSGNDFEQTLIRDSKWSPYFNSNSDSNNSTDTRSDDKGPEPKAITIGQIGSDRYVFVGLERMGGIMVYNINDPRRPVLQGYFNNRNFAVDAKTRAAGDLGLEELVFVAPAQSPVANTALVISSNKVSGSITVYTTGDPSVATRRPALGELKLSVYPNPTADEVITNVTSDFQVFDSNGRQVLQVGKTNRIDLSQLPKGTYLLRDVRNQVSRAVIKQ
jgi:hypothetical protein